MLRWHVAHTHPRAERVALSHLRRQGFTTYLPQYRKLRRHARRVDWVPAPLFPRYLFIGIDIETMRWRAIRSTIGIAGLICDGDTPAPVPDGVIDEIRRREDEEGMVALGASPFQPGDRITVVSGPLAGQAGLFDCMDDDRRVIILLDLLGRRVQVRVGLHAVSAAA